MDATDKTSTPRQPFHIVLVEPEIAPNTGNVARLCAATGSPLHLVEPLGFQINDRTLKRAGVDYWNSVILHRHPNFGHLAEVLPGARFLLFSARASNPYTSVHFEPGDALVFGSESTGLPPELVSRYPDHLLRIPILNPAVRSLNLATAVGIVLYEAIRQTP
jgi:tRNA (cytidine/uridine-2'-O-)-methyltransferase